MILEIKPREHTDDPKTVAKFEAASAWAVERGYEFIVLTQQYFVDNFHRLPDNLSEYIPNANAKLRKIANEASKQNRNT